MAIYDIQRGGSTHIQMIRDNPFQLALLLSLFVFVNSQKTIVWALNWSATTSHSCNFPCTRCPHQQCAHHTFRLVNYTDDQVGPLMWSRTHFGICSTDTPCPQEQPRTITTLPRNYLLQEALTFLRGVILLQEAFISLQGSASRGVCHPCLLRRFLLQGSDYFGLNSTCLFSN